jgi:hypothetical protein
MANASGHRCCAIRAAPPCSRKRETSGRPARREARAPAGQLKIAAPSRSAAGKSAPLETPAHFLALLIVTGTAKTKGLVRAANRAGCRQAAPQTQEFGPYANWSLTSSELWWLPWNSKSGNVPDNAAIRPLAMATRRRSSAHEDSLQGTLRSPEPLTIGLIRQQLAG